MLSDEERSNLWYDTVGRRAPLTTENIMKYSAALERAVLEQAASVCLRLAEDRFSEHGTREYDTNATYYTGPAAEEYDTRDEEDEACADAIRALLPKEES